MWNVDLFPQSSYVSIHIFVHYFICLQYSAWLPSLFILAPAWWTLNHSLKPIANVTALAEPPGVLPGRGSSSLPCASIDLCHSTTHHSSLFKCLHHLVSSELGVVSLAFQCLPHNINPIMAVFPVNFSCVLYNKSQTPSRGMYSSVVSSPSLRPHAIPPSLAQGAPDPLAFWFLVCQTLPAADASCKQPPFPPHCHGVGRMPIPALGKLLVYIPTFGSQSMYVLRVTFLGHTVQAAHYPPCDSLTVSHIFICFTNLMSVPPCRL